MRCRFSGGSVLPWLIVFIFAFAVSVNTGVAFAQPLMKPTGPQKMVAPGEKARPDACQQEAARQNVEMDGRTGCLMDRIKEMTKQQPGAFRG